MSLYRALQWCAIHANKYHDLSDEMINSSPPSAAYMRQLIKSALVQIMAWRLFGGSENPVKF